MKIYKRAILPLGFQASATASGIKKSGKLDLALFYSQRPAKTACLFTTNKIQAAPLKLNQKYLKKNRYFQALIVNSGNANCFTGDEGLRDAEETSSSIAQALKIKKEEVLVASTGIIGRRLPLEKIKNAIPELVKNLSQEGIHQAKKAILTTDTYPKEVTVKFKIEKIPVTICGIAKGSGMIAPNLATMLCFIFTDAVIEENALKAALRLSVDNSFNCITVDGCMSTNDMVLVLANACAGNNPIKKEKNFYLFSKALNYICLELAKLIIKDAEGATKFIKINVKKAKSFWEAKKVALAIANSNLFKTAMYGNNPNFGRVVAAIGASGLEIKEEKIKLNLSDVNKKEIELEVLLNQGDASATIYTSDLSPEYIKINAEYN